MYKQLIHIKELVAEIKQILRKPKFKAYVKVFQRWQFGVRIQSGILCEIFPQESLLDENNQPFVERSRAKYSKKKRKTKKRLSLRGFKKCLGVAPVREYSGKTDKKAKKCGSALARKCLWRFVFSTLERKNVRLNAKVQDYKDRLDTMKENGVPVQKARARCWKKIVTKLFYDLVYELHPIPIHTAA